MSDYVRLCHIRPFYYRLDQVMAGYVRLGYVSTG
jgi:hypothetical protein